jgi:hypothetical protein
MDDRVHGGIIRESLQGGKVQSRGLRASRFQPPLQLVESL